MNQRGERRGQDQFSAWLKQVRKLVEDFSRIGNMLQYFAAQDSIERGIRIGDGSDVAYQINATCIPLAGLQACAVACAFIMTKVLRDIDKVAAKWPIALFSSTGIENTRTLREGRKRFLQPDLAIFFVYVAVGHITLCIIFQCIFRKVKIPSAYR